MAEGLTDQERYLRRVESLALSILPIPDGVLAAAPKHHDGVMVALIPENSERLALDHEEALPADDLHITLCYLGKVDQFENIQKSDIVRTVHRVCDNVGFAFSAIADGVVVMGKNDQGVPATALLVQSDEIVNLYDAISEALDYQSKYPSFIPHMTMGYGVPVDAVQDRLGKPIYFPTVLVKFGEERHVITLSSPLVAAPRGANVIDRVIDSLGRMWDEALHPRGADGRFIKKNGAVSGKLSVPSADGNSVETVNANRASVVGFHTFDNEVWVLAEITNPDGSKVQGFAKASEVRASAPVKARLDALYPISEGDDFVPSSLERKRQLDLLLAHMNKEYGVNDDESGAYEFLETLGLREADLDYIFDGDGNPPLPDFRTVDRELSADELDEVEDIIDDARQVKELRQRVHGLREEAGDFVADDAHVVPQQRMPEPPPDPTDEVAEAIRSGADPFSLALDTPNLLTAMNKTDRFYQPQQIGHVGISPISWRVDDSDETGYDVRLAGTGESTTGRAYFVKESVIGADMGNTDIAKEVLTSLIAEQVADAVGPDDQRLIPIPKSVFGENPVWDGQIGGGAVTHQPAYVVSSHADYAVPADWEKTSVADEEVALFNDIRGLDEAGQADVTAGHYEDMGEIYGNDSARLVLWDFLTLNGDRNPGNAILAAPPDGGEGRVLPIDHGFAFDENPLGPDAPMEDVFGWFMDYPLTKTWMNYVYGGLDMGTTVSPESIRQTIDDFIDVYRQIDADEIMARFQAMPNVNDMQIKSIQKALTGMVDRIEWMEQNRDMILRRLTQRTT